MRPLLLSLIAMVAIMCSNVFAWDGYDWERGSYIEIEGGNLVRPGNDIEIYDYEAGEYKDVEVQSIDRYGSSVEIEVLDYSTGDYRTFDME